MIYNIWLALLAYSCYLTLNHCTICLYCTFLIMAISGGITYGAGYSGAGDCESTSNDSTYSSSGNKAGNNHTYCSGGMNTT